MSAIAIGLHIGQEETVITLMGADAAKRVLVLQLGSQRIAQHYFHHVPPTPDEMENAIMVVEDEISRIRHDIPAGSQLFSNDPLLLNIALLAGVTPSKSPELSLAATELTFDRLARVINGRPAHVEGLPEERDFAATLLILREFMHHLAFDKIVMVS
ncbi:hypothetical protein SJI19_20510 [Acerihabitans sp. TG2]|uniref:hypothetical protein n=1 Tax=Acerihabitans sp. TG2 TaxID=3096008 RepID=UPI002B23CDAC|nr:hypothetical protein [Acerihabitans sp. TG2]MEA9392890.1 hypothetical protein [Acerihabitans sp. TG2]